MIASHAMRSRARRPGPLSIGLIGLLAILAGCGGPPPTAASPTATNPKAAGRQRDMADFMKNQKAK